MKVLLLLCALFAAVSAAPQSPRGEYAQEYGPAVYNFAYSVDAADPYNQPVRFGHQEGRNGASTSGTYYVLLPDTRFMTVNYYADETGFHPTYSFEGQPRYYER
ncbi:pro-resilin-like [Eriocheir sinensis]|uniref:pro-resilin-like n=1 Tax=Eriocheir sinensis TaxID=95602 RepID=UPI0021C88688|nr:pro-resilin-like [Eriocheir sinensis]